MSSNRISGNQPFIFNVLRQLGDERTLPPAVAKNQNDSATAAKLPSFSENIAARTGYDPAASIRLRLEKQLAAQQTNQVELPPRQFQTVGGDWGRDKETGAVKFYRTGFDPNKVERFDQEFYLPDSQKYPLAANGNYVHLNPNGSLNTLPEYAGKPKPEGVSDFEWQGFEWTNAARVPAQYVSTEGTVSFENAPLASNQMNALKRFVVDNNLVQTWDEGKFQQLFGAKAGGSIKLELEQTGESNGKTVFSVKMSEESAAEFRRTLGEYRTGTEQDQRNGIKGQQEEVRMAHDLLAGIYETTRKGIENTINAVPDTLNLVFHEPVGKRSEISFGRAKVGEMYDELAAQSSLKPGEGIAPRLDTSAAKVEFQSEMMRRDNYGDSATDVAGAIAPIVVGEGLKPKAPETLKTLGALPKTGILTVESGRVLSVSERRFANKMVGEGRDVKAFKEINQQNVKNPDFRIDGEIVEFKYVSEISGTTADKLSKGLSGRILDGGSQAAKVALDVTDQAGMTKEIAERGINRAFGRLREMGSTKTQQVRIYGRDFDISVEYIAPKK